MARREEYVVVGAGAMGVATTYHLARRGLPVLLIEQFPIGHDRGSSHGSARIIRHSYANPAYARLMPAAFAAWRTLEAEAAESVYLRTGGVSFCPRDRPYVGEVAANLEAIGVPHRRMTGRDWNAAHPAFAVPSTTDTVFEPDAGMLLASRAMGLELGRAVQIGPDTRVSDRTPVLRIDLEADRPTVVTAAGPIEADRLIVTAGAWTSRLVPSLAGHLRPTRQAVLYLRPADPTPYALGRLPSFIWIGPGDLDAFYGMPGGFGSGVKVARHGGLDVDPDRVDRVVTEADERPVRAFLETCVPGLASAPVERAETCLYTMASGEEFRLAAPAGRPDVIVASPCSGHGFKFSCLIGSILADLATIGTTDHPIDEWNFNPT